MRLKRSGVLGVAAVSVALVLSGCSGSDGTTTEPTEAAPTTFTAPDTSASPTPKPATSTSPAENIEPPVMPEEAKEFTAEGYEAFTNYWYETMYYAFSTGDSQPLRAASDGECGYCNQQAKNADETGAAGGWLVGAQIRPEEFWTDLVADENGLYAGIFDMVQSEGALMWPDDDGAIRVAEEIPGTERPGLFYAAYTDQNGWKAAEIVPDESASRE